MPAFKPQGELKEYTFKPQGELQEFTPGERMEAKPTPTVPQTQEGAKSAITGGTIPTAEEKIQQGKDTAAGLVRYGVPVAAGLATGGWSFPAQLGVGAASTGLSEFTARQIERASTDTTLDTIWQDIKAGGIAGGIDAGVSTILHGLGKGILWSAKKMLLPKAINPEVEAAMGVLATPEQNATARKWWRWKGNEPFSLSPHQLNPEEKGFIYHLESVARSGSGSSKFKNFDERNAKHVQSVIEDYVTKRADNSSAPEFGAFINRVLGKTNNAGELFKPAEAYRSYLYGQYKERLAEYPEAAIDGSNLQAFFHQTKDLEMQNIYRRLSDADLLPRKLSDTKAWKNLDVMNVDETLHQINSLWKNGKENELWNNAIKRMKKNLSDPYDKFLADKPELKMYKEAANKYYGQEQDALRNSVINTVRKKMIDKPSTVLAMFDPTSGNPSEKLDNLKSFKKAMYFSADAPGVMSKRISGIGRPEAEKMWERDVLRPLRFNFVAGLTDSKGILNADLALKKITNIETKRAPELLTEMFGSQKQVDEIKKLFSAMKYVQSTKPQNSVFLQLKTAAAFASTGAGVWSYVTSDDPKRMAAGLAGSAAVLMGPAVLAKTLTNPRLTRALYDGFTDQRLFTGWSPKLSLALRKIGQQKAASEIARDVPSGDAAQFYSFAPMEQENNE